MKSFPILFFLLCPLILAAAPPNIVVIFVDDLGYADTGFNGSQEIKTPNLDALAANGVICKNGYTTHAYCGPSRVGLLTGIHQARLGLEINLTYSPYDIHSGIPTEIPTFATRLKSSGYRTGIIGKWHLGASPPFHPNNRGFDYFYGFLSGGHDYFPDTIDFAHPLTLKNGSAHYSANEGSFLPLQKNRNSTQFKGYLTTALSQEAARFVKKGDKPFCLYLSYNAPHRPLQAPRETIEKYSHIESPRRRVYAAMIDEMDAGVGQVVAALKESNKFENTLIFFLSDNGGAWPDNGKRPTEDFANNAPFAEGKGSYREGGIHVPFFVHWPAGLKGAPKEFDGLVSALDIASTAVAVATANQSAAPALEGVNLIPFLKGENQAPPREALYWRDKGYSAVRTAEAKLLTHSDGKEQTALLYDMKSDPYEEKNLADDPAFQETRSKLAKLWNEWNQGNTPTFLLQSTDYQKTRLDFYRKQFEELRKAKQGEKARLIH